MKHTLLFEINFVLEGVDFEFIPTPRTTRLLDGHRMVLRSSSNKLRVITPLDDAKDAAKDAPFLPFSKDDLLCFNVKLNHPDLPLDFAQLEWNTNDSYDKRELNLRSMCKTLRARGFLALVGVRPGRIKMDTSFNIPIEAEQAR